MSYLWFNVLWSILEKSGPERARKNVFNRALGIARNDEWTQNEALHWIVEMREIDPTSFLQVKRRDTRGRATTSSTRHLSQFLMPQWDVVLTSTCFHLTFLWRQSARLKTIFLTSQRNEARSYFFKHGTSKVRQRPEINQSFHIVSYLWFIVLCLRGNQLLCSK